uniref:C-type lectin domain-containing protein n=1 Tax=Poecilia latipinna TaxID=48699 RepID=A0A3B3UKH1_9TELE
YCRTHHTDLITITEETVDLTSNYNGWIGLHREDKASDWKWSTGEKATFFRWNNNNNCYYYYYDNSCDGGWNCVYKKYQQNKWCCGICHWDLPFFCYDEILVLVKENKTWEEALEHCRNMKEMKNYTLATLNTPDDHDFAREKAQLATTEEVWTGLRYLGDEWFWVGGEPVQYQNIPSCPAERCGVLEKNSNSSFGIRDCNERRNFFCYIKP